MTVSVAMLSTNINNLPQEIVTKQKANLHNITPISSLSETADAILFLGGSKHGMNCSKPTYGKKRESYV